MAPGQLQPHPPLLPPRSRYWLRGRPTPSPTAVILIAAGPPSRRCAAGELWGVVDRPNTYRWLRARLPTYGEPVPDATVNELVHTDPDKLRGLLPRIYAGFNLDRENATALINLCSKDIFEQDHGGEELIGRVYEPATTVVRLAGQMDETIIA